jgi:hypothetical protein
MSSFLDVTVRVGLKGVDPVISTAYLTLVEKMGYQGRLLALNRLESFAFRVGCEDPATALSALRRLLATQSIFYNRNKHNYFFECLWDGHAHREGVSLESLESMASQLSRWAQLDESQDSDSQKTKNRVMLQTAPIYRTGVLVEDIDPATRTGLGARLERELGTGPVTVSELGIRWYLALGVQSKEIAEAVTQEIVVAEGRDRGLLLNPNYQRHKRLSVSRIDAE